jgi:hypothetical protein
MDKSKKKALFDDDEPRTKPAKSQSASSEAQGNAGADFNINSDFAAQYDRKKRREAISKRTQSSVRHPGSNLRPLNLVPSYATPISVAEPMFSC